MDIWQVGMEASFMLIFTNHLQFSIGICNFANQNKQMT